MRIRTPDGNTKITRKTQERMEKQYEQERLPELLAEKEQLLALSQAEAVELLLEENMSLQLAMAEMIEMMMGGDE